MHRPTRLLLAPMALALVSTVFTGPATAQPKHQPAPQYPQSPEVEYVVDHAAAARVNEERAFGQRIEDLCPDEVMGPCAIR